jgi:hypothetical protein
MRIGRAIIIPAILALGVAGSAVAGSAIPLAAGHLGHVTSHHLHKTVLADSPDLFYHA